jgi:hypothetical protein
VQKDRTVTLDGAAFGIDAARVGDYVTLRFRKPPDISLLSSKRGGTRVECFGASLFARSQRFDRGRLTKSCAGQVVE